MGRTTARRLLQSVLASEWAIRPEWLEQFAGVASRMESDSSALTPERVRSEIQDALATLSEDRQRTDALTFDSGQPLGENTRATVRDGVAIVPVMGPLYHYADGFTQVCGCSAYDQIARDIAAIRTAAASGLVSAVLLEVDSPGGEVGGCAECAGMIAELAAEMPVTAYISDLGCSAAYWLASAAREIVVAPTALLGSIGVVASYRAKGNGNAAIEIVSSQSPKKRPNVETEEGRAQIQATVDALGEEFVSAVAKQRGVSEEKVLADFGQGDVFVGKRAVAAGLADRVGTFEGVLAELAKRADAAQRGAAVAGGFTISQEANVPEETKPAANNQPAPLTVAQLRAEHSAAVQEIETAATTAERTRITGILGLARTDADRTVAMAAVESGATRGDAAAQILEARDAVGQREADRAARHVGAMKADEKELDAPGANPPSTEDDNSEAAQVNRIINAGRLPTPSTN